MLKFDKFDSKTALMFVKFQLFTFFTDAGINLTSQVIILPKMNKFLLMVTEIWVRMDTQLDRHKHKTN